MIFFNMSYNNKSIFIKGQIGLNDIFNMSYNNKLIFIKGQIFHFSKYFSLVAEVLQFRFRKRRSRKLQV